jgi:hypothetical protein
MKIILFSLCAVVLIIVVQCLEQTETNIKQAAASQGETYDKCRKGKKGKYSCRCGKKKVIYDGIRQTCINGKVVKR